MKYLRIKCLTTGVMFMLMFSIIPGFTAQKSYPIFCKIGPETLIKYSTNHKTFQKSLHLSFIRGNKPAIHGVDEGTCAWRDRGVNSDEPNHICHRNIDDISFVINPIRRKIDLKSQKAPYLSHFLQGTQISLLVFNDNNKCMNVTGVNQ